METTSDLCASCRLFDLYSFQRDVEGYRGYTFQKVTEGAKGGCRFCTMLHDCFKTIRSNEPYIHLRLDRTDAGGDDHVDSLSTASLRVVGMEAKLGYKTAFERDFDREWSKKTYLYVVADPESPAAQTQVVVGQYHADYHSLEYYIQNLRERIEDCLQHEKCCERLSGLPLPEQGSGPLPTRCLELCGERVFLRSTEGMNGSYLTLSHRWNAETEETRTTMTNYEERLNGIWDCSLPKLFTDVLDLAQRLQVKYVWIDSICIIQAGDEGRDWRQEAVKMATYYQGSLITVMATSATSKHGLYPENSHSLSTAQFARLPYRNQDGRVQGHFFIYRNSLTGGEQFESSVIASELLSRGWVFQEYHLSRRAVSFTPHGMFFTCQTRGSVNDRDERTGSETYFTTTWYEKYLSQYSGLHLTKPAEDRLVALSGVMGEYLLSLTTDAARRRTGRRRRVSNRLAQPSSVEEDTKAWWNCGLWRFDILAGLVWQQDKISTVGGDRLSNYPTWSWASVLAPVSWNGMGGVAGVMLENIALLGPDERPRNNDDTQHHLQSTLEADGNLVPVLVRGRFESRREVDVVSHLSDSEEAHGLDEEIPRADNWRKICLPGSSDLVSGWASIEHSTCQEDSDFVQSPVIYALAVFSNTGRAAPYAQGHFRKEGMVYTVLYVRSVVGGEKYERLGVGKLYGDKAETAFQISQKRRMTLV